MGCKFEKDVRMQNGYKDGLSERTVIGKMEYNIRVSTPLMILPTLFSQKPVHFFGEKEK